jgi:putative sterol carrier protein
MAGVFPDTEWLMSFVRVLNSTDSYAQIARKWEGDILFEIFAEGALEEDTYIYLDLWHGRCRSASFMENKEDVDPAFILSAPFSNFARVAKGDLDPMQAMLTRKLAVKGNMGYMLRNVPVVIEFVRCANKITDKVLGDD